MFATILAFFASLLNILLDTVMRIIRSLLIIFVALTAVSVAFTCFIVWLVT